MTWNHRVVHRLIKRMPSEREGEHWYAVHEVYYDESGKPEMTTVEAVAPGGETLDELRQELDRFQKALEHPVLEYDSFTDEQKS